MNPKHFNTSEWAWEQSCTEIARTVGMDPTLVRKIKGHIFGYGGFTPKWERKYGHLDWDKVDWVSMNDTMVGRMLGVEPSVPRRYRIWNKKPFSFARSPTSVDKIPTEELQAIDWDLTADIEIAEKFGVSRERIRQIRVGLGKGESKMHRLSAICREAYRWMVANKDKLQGEHVNEVIKQSPLNVPTWTQQTARTKLKRFAKEIGIKLKWGSKVPKHVSKYSHMDMKLPDTCLGRIWGVTAHLISKYRYQHRLRSPKWKHRGFGNQTFIPEFIGAVIAEIYKAQAMGVEVSITPLEQRYQFTFPIK